MWAFIGKLVAKVTGNAIKSGVDTAKGVTDIQKNRLDIKLKKQELEGKERLVRMATFEEVKEFDPKIKAIAGYLKDHPCHPDHPSLSRRPYFEAQIGRFVGPLIGVLVGSLIVHFRVLRNGILWIIQHIWRLIHH
jgi:hypothetical protein